MRVRLTPIAVVLALVAAGIGGTAAYASSGVTQVRAVYRTVLSAEYFGPASAFCSRLTAAGVKSFTAGGAGTCKHAFDQQQQILKHKTPGDDDSGYTAGGWREIVNFVLKHLKVTVHGSHATAIGGESGIPGQTSLVKVNGKWLFNSYPPSIQS
jgi:hypothetical protein